MADVVVTQEDREAAASECKKGGALAFYIRSRRNDSHPLVQAFARHRIAAEQRVKAQAAEVARAHKRVLLSHFDEGFSAACDNIATAISNMETSDAD